MDWRKLNLSFQNPDFDWDGFLYLNDETVPRAAFVQAVMQSGILPAAVAWRGGSNEFPNLATERMMRMLRTLAAEGVQRVALWGAGEHTRRLVSALRAAPLRIVGLLDDNAKLHGTHVGPYRVHAPDEAPRLGAQAVVISTDRAEAALWARRGPLEARGIAVRRLYAGSGQAREELCTGV
jgi:FlaA1/EpsC-like NDP-sugar epimerase